MCILIGTNGCVEKARPAIRLTAFGGAIRPLRKNKCVMRARSKLWAIALAIAPCSALGFSDFNGDGRSDLLWRNTATGANAIWFSANRATPQTADRGGQSRLADRRSGDYNGDGKADILWRNSSTGANVIWRSAGTRPASNRCRAVGPRWPGRGSADYNGDGRADILWRNTATGAQRDLAFRHRVHPATVGLRYPLAWQVVGFGRLQRRREERTSCGATADTGANVIWRSAIPSTQQNLPPVAPSPLAGRRFGGLQRRRRADILWRNAQRRECDLAFGVLRHAAGGQGGLAGIRPGTSTDSGDYNGDGFSDILWRRLLRKCQWHMVVCQ